MRNTDLYPDYKPESFIYRAKRTVYKWWCVVYRPVYVLTHNGYWPPEKDPINKYPSNAPTPVNEMAAQLASEILQENSFSDEDIVLSAKQSIAEEDVSTQASDVPTQSNDSLAAQSNEPVTAQSNESAEEIDTSGMDPDALNRANEIMERLAREAAEDEAKKQAEIEAAKQKALESERLAMIMQANKVDISSFIEEGKELQATTTDTDNQED